MSNGHAESERQALALIAHFAARLSARDAQLLEEMATHNEWGVAIGDSCSIIEYDWDRLTTEDLVILEEVGSRWERPEDPITWAKFRSLVAQ